MRGGYQIGSRVSKYNVWVLKIQDIELPTEN
jgi:hypothetical protein